MDFLPTRLVHGRARGTPNGYAKEQGTPRKGAASRGGQEVQLVGCEDVIRTVTLLITTLSHRPHGVAVRTRGPIWIPFVLIPLWAQA